MHVELHRTDHVKGKSEHPTLTLIEYGDYQCSYCKAAVPITDALLGKFPGQVSFAFRHFPLTQIHEWAQMAAQLAEAAGLQGKFWGMHHLLFSQTGELTEDDVIRYLELLNIDRKRFLDDFVSDQVVGKIRSDFLSGVKLGVQGTPSFFVNGAPFHGNWATGDLEWAIAEKLLRPSIHS